MKKGEKTLISRRNFLESKPIPLTRSLFKEGQGNREGVLVNIKNGVYYTMNHSAQKIWQFMDGKVHVSEIARRVAKTYDIAPAKAVRNVEKYVRVLLKEGLIKMK